MRYYIQVNNWNKTYKFIKRERDSAIPPRLTIDNVPYSNTTLLFFHRIFVSCSKCHPPDGAERSNE